VAVLDAEPDDWGTGTIPFTPCPKHGGASQGAADRAARESGALTHLFGQADAIPVQRYRPLFLKAERTEKTQGAYL
jgi:hypothetical protein